MNLDFSSSLYLGMRHGSLELPGWDSLTTGVPASYFEPSDAVALGKSLARLQGLEDGIVAPSTLHLFWDWFGGLKKNKDVVFVDAQIYRLGAWGVERAAGKGIQTVRFRHQSAISLQRLVNLHLRNRQRPIIVTDGWCPFCGKAAPLQAYLDIIAARDGLLIIDDTQALGIFGRSPSAGMPYGYGGGGLCRYLNVKNERIITITSLAKAFGVPMAVLAGSKQEIHAFKLRSETRVNSSPPAATSLAVGKHALRLNSTYGNEWRKKLLTRVTYFKERMAANGFATKGGVFPVQTIPGLEDDQVRWLQKALWQKGIQTVSVLAHSNHPKLCWVLNTQHTDLDIEQACDVFFELAFNGYYFKHYKYENDSGRNFVARNIR